MRKAIMIMTIAGLFLVSSCNRSPDVIDALSLDAEAFYAECVTGASLKTLVAGADTGRYNVLRGQEAVFRIVFDKPFSRKPFAFVTNSSECRDFTFNTDSLSLDGFDVCLNFSQNSSAGQATGDYSFDWLAFPSNLDAKDIMFGSDSLDYDMSRGESDTSSVHYRAVCKTVPVVFLVGTTAARDFFVGAAGVTTEGFDVRIRLSGNSSLASAQGTYSFQWLALPKDLSVRNMELGRDSARLLVQRGGFASKTVGFEKLFKKPPIILLSQASCVPDVYYNTSAKNVDSFSVSLNASRNSSAALIDGMFDFYWLAIGER